MSDAALKAQIAALAAAAAKVAAANETLDEKLSDLLGLQSQADAVITDANSAIAALATLRGEQVDPALLFK